MWTLVLRKQLPVERFNAEISLLTGVCAARLMLAAGYGILRTVPPPDQRAIDRLRHAAQALGILWPDGAAAGDVLAGVDPSDGRHFAFLEHAAALLRGAAYTTFDTAVDSAPPAQPFHAGIGAAYAHVTAPLRRLVDRYASEVCLAVHAKGDVPPWVRDRLPALPSTMAAADSRAHAADRAVIDATEAWLLADRVGERFAATVIDANTRSATIVIENPAIRGRCIGENLAVGGTIQVTLTKADVAARVVEFSA